MIITILNIILVLSILGTAMLWFITDSRHLRQLYLIVNQILFFAYIYQNTDPIVAGIFIFLGIIVILFPVWMFPFKRQEKPANSQKSALVLKILATALFLVLSLIALLFLVRSRQQPETGASIQQVHPTEILWIFFILFALFFIQLYQMIKGILNTND